MLNNPASLDRTFHALANPSRRNIIEGLAIRAGSVSELAESLDMSLPGVLQHLQVLEASGLIESEKVGRVRTCRLRVAALEEVEVWIARRRALWQRRLDRLGHYLDVQDARGRGGGLPDDYRNIPEPGEGA